MKFAGVTKTETIVKVNLPDKINKIYNALDSVFNNKLGR